MHDTSAGAELQAAHTPAAIVDRLSGSRAHSYLRDFIYGAIDGIVTTFAVVAGVAGAGLSATIVIVIGAANLIADGFSMGVSNFLATRAEHQQRERTRRIEEREIRLIPEGEREEIREIYRRKGFEGEDLEHVVGVLTADEALWIDTMLREEHGLSGELPNALRAGATTFVAFFVAGLLPLLTFVAERVRPGLVDRPFLASAVLASAGFFVVGIVKARFVDQPRLVSAAETLAIGGAAAALAFVAGGLVKGLAGV